jgi:hypothetical protein
MAPAPHRTETKKAEADQAEGGGFGNVLADQEALIFGGQKFWQRALRVEAPRQAR